MPGPFDYSDPSLAPVQESTNPWLRMFGQGTDPETKEAARQYQQELTTREAQIALTRKLNELAALQPQANHAQLMNQLVNDEDAGKLMMGIPSDKLQPVLKQVLESLRPSPSIISIPQNTSAFSMTPGDMQAAPFGFGPTTVETHSPFGEKTGEIVQPGGLVPGAQKTPFSGLTSPEAMPTVPGSTVAPAEAPVVPTPLPPTSTQTPAAPAPHATTPDLSFVPPEYMPFYQAASAKWGVPIEILAKQGGHESLNWHPDIVSGKRLSPAGAAGVGQFMPEMAKHYGIDPTQPGPSIDAQAQFMSTLYKKYGDWNKALMAYNTGETNFDRAGGDPSRLAAETRAYPDKVNNYVGPGSTQYATAGMPQSTTITTVADLPDVVKKEDLDRIATTDKSSMFLGAGALPYIVDIAGRTSRQVDENWGDGLPLAIASAKGYQKELSFALSSLREPGQGTTKDYIAQAQAMGPQFGPGTDPILSVYQGMRLHDFIIDRLAQNTKEINNEDNSVDPETRKILARENARFKQVLRALPSRGQMEKMANLIQTDPENAKVMMNNFDPDTPLSAQLITPSTLWKNTKEWLSKAPGATGQIANQVLSTEIPEQMKVGQGPNKELSITQVEKASLKDLEAWRDATNSGRSAPYPVSAPVMSAIIRRLQSGQ